MRTDSRDEFVERAGMHFQRLGLSRTAGRVLGWLLITPDGSADAVELRDALAVAKSSLSVALRQLENVGLVERFRPPRQRRDHYRVSGDVFGRAFHNQMSELDAMQRLVAHGLDVAGDDPTVRERLQLMSDMYGFMAREFPKLLDRWEQEKRAGADDAR